MDKWRLIRQKDKKMLKGRVKCRIEYAHNLIIYENMLGLFYVRNLFISIYLTQRIYLDFYFINFIFVKS